MITYILKIPIKHSIEARKNYTAKVKKMIQRDTKVKPGFDLCNVSDVKYILEVRNIVSLIFCTSIRLSYIIIDSALFKRL